MTTEQMTNLIHEAWEKFIHAPYPDIAFYRLFELSMLESTNQAYQEIAARLMALGTGEIPVPSELHDVPYVAMQKIAEWIKTHE